MAGELNSGGMRKRKILDLAEEGQRVRKWLRVEVGSGGDRSL